MSNNEIKYDVAVVGGGAAGMMAAGRAAEMGARVVLLEKNKALGKKIAITGKGRCNVTQAEFDLRKLIAAYGKNGKFLFSVFNVFGPQEVVNFFINLGIEMKIERGGRVFPVSDDANDLIVALKKYLVKNKVEILTGTEVVGFIKDKNKVSQIKLKTGMIEADRVIVTTGGQSYPGTGSTGVGYAWAKQLGHEIIAPRPALVPIKITESWVKTLQGLSLKNVTLSLCQGGKKITDRFGEMLFTHFGISGPIVLDISKEVGEYLSKGGVKLCLDLKPALSLEKLDERLQRDFKKYQNKMFKNSLDELLPQKMIPLVMNFSEIDPEKEVNKISREERLKLVGLLKKMEMTVKDLMGFEMAIVTTGGVSLKEVDQKTMRSKIIDNLYFAGEILDIDGPTGGYNLQVAWSTGRAAGEAAAV